MAPPVVISITVEGPVMPSEEVTGPPAGLSTTATERAIPLGAIQGRPPEASSTTVTVKGFIPGPETKPLRFIALKTILPIKTGSFFISRLQGIVGNNDLGKLA